MANLVIARQIPTNAFKSANPLIGTVLENYRLTAPGRPPPNDVRHLVLSSEGLSYIPGVCSKMLCDCEPGDKVNITGPAGKRFVLPADFHDRDMIFVATGTGIAPFRGMLKEMFDQDYRGSVFLFFGVQYADTILYDNEFKSYLSWTRKTVRSRPSTPRPASSMPPPE